MNTRHLPKGHIMSNIDRAAEVIGPVMSRWDMDGRPDMAEGIDRHLARALADAGRLRPDPSSRYDGYYQTAFARYEEAGDGPHIEACVDIHCPAPEWEIVHRADVSIDIGGEHGYHNLHAFATAEWCREAAAVLLDVADEVDRKNKETDDKRAEGVGTDE